MDSRDLDLLVMQNSNDWLGGYVRWFTGTPANNAYPRAVVFARDGMTVVEQGPFGGTKPGGDTPSYRGVTEVRTTPSYVSASFTANYDAELVLDVFAAAGARRIGWVAPAASYHGFGRALEAADDVTFVDVTEQIDVAKAIKSDEEWSAIRKTIALQDEVMTAVRGFVAPGMYDFEVAAFAQYEAQVRGAEQGIFIGSSSPRSKAAVFRPRHEQGRRIESGDSFALLVETNGPGGYYAEIGRMFVLGEADAPTRRAIDAAVAAQAATLERLVPGAAAADIALAHDRYMSERGLPIERRLYSHGQGYDMVERPLIRSDETMSIAQDMSIVVHPGYITEEANALICDNYRIGAEGPGGCLHQTPKTVLETR